MKRIACLLALLLLLIGSTASAEQDYDDLYARILDFSAVGPAYDENFDDLPEAAQTLYVAAIYDMEMRCGGVCKTQRSPFLRISSCMASATSPTAATRSSGSFTPGGAPSALLSSRSWLTMAFI